MDGKKIGDFIRWKRESLGFTVEQLASQTGVSPQTIEDWENGEIPSTEYLLALSKALQTDVDELLVGREEKQFCDTEKEKPADNFGRSFKQSRSESNEKKNRNGFGRIERIAVCVISAVILFFVIAYHC